METATATPVWEYLRTDYSPDVDYVDGVLEERNAGEKDHAWLQGALLVALSLKRRELGLHIYAELRLKISDTRYRIPDLCVFATEPEEQIPSRPPLLAIEILSPEDRMGRMQRKIRDFLSMGVSYVWVIDPQSRSGSIHTTAGSTDVTEGVFSAGPITVNLAELDQ